jgi:hypothetical protein
MAGQSPMVRRIHFFTGFITRDQSHFLNGTSPESALSRYGLAFFARREHGATGSATQKFRFHKMVLENQKEAGTPSIALIFLQFYG